MSDSFKLRKVTFSFVWEWWDTIVGITLGEVVMPSWVRMLGGFPRVMILRSIDWMIDISPSILKAGDGVPIFSKTFGRKKISIRGSSDGREMYPWPGQGGRSQ